MSVTFSSTCTDPFLSNYHFFIGTHCTTMCQFESFDLWYVTFIGNKIELWNENFWFDVVWRYSIHARIFHNVDVWIRSYLAQIFSVKIEHLSWLLHFTINPFAMCRCCRVRLSFSGFPFIANTCGKYSSKYIELTSVLLYGLLVRVAKWNHFPLNGMCAIYLFSCNGNSIEKEKDMRI